MDVHPDKSVFISSFLPVPTLVLVSNSAIGKLKKKKKGFCESFDTFKLSLVDSVCCTNPTATRILSYTLLSKLDVGTIANAGVQAVHRANPFT